MIKYLIVAVVALGVMIATVTMPVSEKTVAVLAVSIAATGVSVVRVLDNVTGGEEK
jgi:hypothetical protein